MVVYSIHHFIGREGLIGYVSMHLRWIDIDYTHCTHSAAKHTQLPNLLLQKLTNVKLCKVYLLMKNELYIVAI